MSSNSKNSDGMSPRGINTQLLGSQFFLFISREVTVGFRKNCVAVVFTSLLCIMLNTVFVQSLDEIFQYKSHTSNAVILDRVGALWVYYLQYLCPKKYE